MSDEQPRPIENVELLTDEVRQGLGLPDTITDEEIESYGTPEWMTKALSGELVTGLTERIDELETEVNDCHDQIDELEAEVVAKIDWYSPRQVIALIEEVHKRYEES